jgi:hypothetical protein
METNKYFNWTIKTNDLIKKFPNAPVNDHTFSDKQENDGSYLGIFSESYLPFAEALYTSPIMTSNFKNKLYMFF